MGALNKTVCFLILVLALTSCGGFGCGGGYNDDFVSAFRMAKENPKRRVCFTLYSPGYLAGSYCLQQAT